MTRAEFIQKIAPYCVADMKDSKILASLSIAQGILESANGGSGLTQKANNLFGIKANSSWSGPYVTMPTKEYINGQWITIDANFRKYDSWLDSINDHSKFLTVNKRYAKVVGETNYKLACQYIWEAGYATDPTYPAKLISLIETNNLQQYDKIDNKEGNTMGKVGKIIALDDGHGMKTAGKRTPNFDDGTFMHENEFNRSVIKYLDAHLQRCGFDTLLTAPTDEDTPLKARTDLANNIIKNKYNRAVDYFISVHANAYKGVWSNENSTAQGTSTHLQSGLSKTGDTYKYAQIIHKHLMKGTKMNDRGIVFQDLHVTRETKMPAVLVECAFMDNIHDAKFLLSDSFRKECAEELAKAVCEIYNVTYVEEPKPEPTPTPVVPGEVRFKVDGKNFTTSGQLIEGRNLVPARELLESMGYKVEWIDNTVVASK